MSASCRNANGEAGVLPMDAPAGASGQSEAPPQEMPSSEDIIRSMLEATERARDAAVHWLMLRERMARLVAESETLRSDPRRDGKEQTR